MSYETVMIAQPKGTGVERDLEAFLLPDNQAYPDLQDCYLWRGRIVKRQGFDLLARLRRQIGTTDGTNPQLITLPNFPLTQGSSQFTIGSNVYQDPTGTEPVVLLKTGGVNLTLTYSTGLLSIAGAPGGSAIFYYPGLPVMGLATLDQPTINVEALIGFDTRFSYLYNAPNFQDLTFYKASSSPFIWHGDTFNLFWTWNYQAAMFATNNIPGLDGRPFLTITNGGTTTITVAGNVTALFLAGDYVYINPDASTILFSNDTRKQGSGIIVSSTFGGPNTTIVVAVASTGAGTTGNVFNATRQIGNGTIIGDGIKWLDQDKSGWVNFQPQLNGDGTSANFLQTALMVIPYKGRFIALNTTEDTLAAGSPRTFPQRVRWSQNGSVYYSNPIPSAFRGGADAYAWRDDIVGKGGFLDNVSTAEHIVSAEFVKDTLIVYFERSTYQLRYTGNPALPFIWEQINTELGSQSTFSIVPFDDTTIAVGNVGIHACDSVNVRRIDQKIPDETFALQLKNHGVQRVFGIRDYLNQLVYWAVPYVGYTSIPNEGVSADVVFNNKLIVFNYIDNTFSFFNDSFTCFGNVQQASTFSTVLWSDTTVTWGSGTVMWSSPQNNPDISLVVAGNQQGYVEVVMQEAFNDPSLTISDILGQVITSINHNLQPGQFVQVIASGISVGNNAIHKVISVTVNTLTIDTPLVGTFTGNGTLTVVNNISVLTKRFNQYLGNPNQIRLGMIDFFFNRTTNGQVTINIFDNEDSSVPINEPPTPIPLSTVSALITGITKAAQAVVTISSTATFNINDVVFFTTVLGMVEINGLSGIVIAKTATLLTVDIDSTAFTVYTAGGTIWNISQNTANIINTFPESTYENSPDVDLVNAKLWKRLQFYDISQLFQVQITMNDVQMKCLPIVSEDIEMHAMCLYFSKSGRLINV